MVNVARPLALRGRPISSRYRVTFAAVNVLVPGDLDADQLQDVRHLLASAQDVDQHPSLPDPQRHDLANERVDPSRLTVLLAYDGALLVAGGFLAPATDGTDALHLVIDPAHRAQPEGDALRASLLERAREIDRRPLRLWAMRATGDDDRFAAEHGFALERALLQMRVELPLDPGVMARTRRMSTRPFEPGRDDANWIDVNNRAFAGHPEQGNWTLERLQERLAAPWVDLHGFLVADDPDGPGLLGSCWTKIHDHTTPPMGEIYVISVDPARHGQGLGRALTLAGLQWLSEQGLTVGMLYTDDDNAAAVATYTGLGFTIDHTDRAYRQQPPSP
jgi:mycothiol synthase